MTTPGYPKAALSCLLKSICHLWYMNSWFNGVCDRKTTKRHKRPCELHTVLIVSERKLRRIKIVLNFSSDSTLTLYKRSQRFKVSTRYAGRGHLHRAFLTHEGSTHKCWLPATAWPLVLGKPMRNVLLHMLPLHKLHIRS